MSARWLFLAAFACSCVLTSASRRASGADSQDVYLQYEEDRQHAEAEEPDYHHAEGKHIRRICLQQSSRTQLPGGRVTEIKFRCCTPADEPDACASNSTSYPGYQHRRHRREEDDRAFWDVVTQEPAATCRYAQSDDACPTFASTLLSCATLQANCTLGPAAEECGLPAGHGGLAFSTKLYDRIVRSLVCDSQGGVTPEAPFEGLASVLQGGINVIATREGYKEVKGSVEFIDEAGDGTPAEEPYPDLPWVKAGQQIIRLLDDTWDYQG